MASVLGIVANFHSGGRTSTAVTAVLDGAANDGADIRMLEVSSANLDEAVEAIAESCAVVFGSPTYRASTSSVMQQLLEKLERGKLREQTAPLRGTAVAIVMTGASFHHYLAPEQLRSVLSSFFASQVLSPSLYLDHSSLDEDEQLTAEVRALAARHGAALNELAVAIGASSTLHSLEPLI